MENYHQINFEDKYQLAIQIGHKLMVFVDRWREDRIKIENQGGYPNYSYMQFK